MRLPTRQDGVENRDKVYYEKLTTWVWRLASAANVIVNLFNV